jgi:hypothetical protein
MTIEQIASTPVEILFALSAVLRYLDGAPTEIYRIFPSGESTPFQDGRIKYWTAIGELTLGPDVKSNSNDPLVYVIVMLPRSVIV